MPGTRRLDDLLAQRPELSDYAVFGFVRNPWARLLSWHAMILRRSEVAQQEGREALATVVANKAFWAGVIERYPDFESFVLRGTEEFSRLRRPQLDYLRTPTRSADFVGRTESLDEDFTRACELVSVPAPTVVERRNHGPRLDYREHYTDEMADRVAQLFAPDLEEFGYTF